MDYCEKWRLAGLAIGLAPFVLALFAGTAAARWPRRFLAGAALAAAAVVVTLAATRPASLILWNGLRPAICDRMD
ncbi:hypothetical protein [Oceanicella actignis]|uniref:hypothetical protein n=1 Tax=Oceanicella actignis TaxID=1189325 RepID=UPI0011E62CDC|nr:hypothetical protein [Oceanicella actignis]TYO90081.1 hypothetical protein LY05_01280 [Oceanicella actignis]